METEREETAAKAGFSFDFRCGRTERHIGGGGTKRSRRRSALCRDRALPIALGCMIPPVLFFAMDYSKNHELGLLLFTLGVFAAVFIFVHLAMKYGVRMGLEGRRRELQALRALRESLLDSEE